MVRLNIHTLDAIVTATIALECVTEDANLGAYRNASLRPRKKTIPRHWSLAQQRQIILMQP